MSKQDYDNLLKIARKARVLEGISSLLEWDQETQMPEGAVLIRAEQLSTLAGMIHKEKTGSSFSKALSKLIDIPTGKLKAKSLDEYHQSAVIEWRRLYLKSTSLPASFVEQFTKLSAQAMEAWKHARKKSDFHEFKPWLEKLIELSRQKAELLGYRDHPYDALLDQYEPGLTTKELTPLFKKVQKAISQLVSEIVKAKQVDNSFLHGNFPEAKQISFGKEILKAMGYDMRYGRLDFSTHPFSSSSHPTDSRITTRIHDTSLMSNISVILHEGGHSLYEMGLPIDQYGSPLGDSVSLGLHESQSRWWETRIGLSLPFWKYFFPKLQKTFAPKLNKISLESFYRGINQAQPSFIRVEADEVTYPLHVILRFEMEKELIEGSLDVKDIPEAWNDKMTRYLGITPQNDAQGCLQDVHWSMGAFGYFPTYALGNMYAAHFFLAFEKQFPNWEKRVEKGDLLFIKQWLNEKIHQHGRMYFSKELLKKVTGVAFSEKAYLDYLKNKYTKIYGL